MDAVERRADRIEQEAQDGERRVVAADGCYPAAMLTTYFAGERAAGLLVAVLGIASLALALWLFRSASPFRAMFIPLALVGFVQCSVGATLVARTPGQVAALEAGLREEPVATRNAEIARMQKVQRGFRLIEAGEAGLVVIGLALIFGASARPVAVGVGMGLLVEAAVMLAFDVFAEQRGARYLDWLQRTVGG